MDVLGRDGAGGGGDSDSRDGGICGRFGRYLAADGSLGARVGVDFAGPHAGVVVGKRGFQTYYRATVFGEVTLTEGVDELIRGEREFGALYDSSERDED